MERAGRTALPFFIRVAILTLAGHHGKTTYSSGHGAPGYVAFLTGASAQQNYRSRAGARQRGRAADGGIETGAVCLHGGGDQR